jgi:putative endonuclease
MSRRRVLGKRGEALAAEYLKSKGYRILEINWRSGHREVDIIAQDNDQIVFIEVKTRTGIYSGNPVEAVDYQKQRLLIDAAEDYINLNNIDMEARFDIVTVIINGNSHRINHISEAFYSGLN